MALKRFKVDKYGQLELNNVFFRREGAIEAQCALDPEKFAVEGEATTQDSTKGKIYAENGMILAVDKANGIVKLPTKVESFLPLALNYSTEHMYDERHKNLGSYYLPAGTFYPRMGYLKRGEVFTTNCLAYDDTTFAATEDKTSDEVFIEALKTPGNAYFGIPCELGAIQIINGELAGAEETDKRIVLRVVKCYTMPDGTPGVKFQVIGTMG